MTASVSARLLLSLLVLLVLPAGAGASQLATKPVPIAQGYALSVTGGDGSPVRLELLKKVPGGSQDILITRRAVYSARPDLAKASLKATLGPFGRISLTFRARGAMHGLGVPKGCSGKRGEGRDGVVTGAIALDLGGTPVRLGRAPAVLTHRGGDILCLDPRQYPDGSRARLSMQVDPETSFRVDATPAGTLSAATLDRDYPDGTELLSVVNQRAPTGFGVTGALARVAGTGPWFSGTLSFLQGLGIGRVTGSDFQIVFDFVGVKEVGAGIDGILRAPRA